MSYYNPLLHYGLDKFAHDAAASGFDGILATDLTVEESEPFVAAMSKSGLNTVFRCPTSPPERIGRSQASTGFLYAVSRTGVTGERAGTLDGAALLSSTPGAHVSTSSP